MEFKDDCIHLKACRRLCKMHNLRNRGCNENCTAYESESDYIEKDVAIDISRQALRDMEYGYSYDDLSCEIERKMWYGY